MFITNDAARNDLACQMAMASYAARLQAEEARRQAIRDAAAAGTYQAPEGQWGTWHISDRH